MLADSQKLKLNVYLLKSELSELSPTLGGVVFSTVSNGDQVQVQVQVLSEHQSGKSCTAYLKGGSDYKTTPSVFYNNTI